MWPFTKKKPDVEREVLKISITTYEQKITKLEKATSRLVDQTLKDVLDIKSG